MQPPGNKITTRALLRCCVVLRARDAISRAHQNGKLCEAASLTDLTQALLVACGKFALWCGHFAKGGLLRRGTRWFIRDDAGTADLFED